MRRNRKLIRAKNHHSRPWVERLESRDLLDSIPLNDLGPGLYQGFEGGLYPGGMNARPTAFEAAGERIAQQIVPLNASGQPDALNGRIAMISVGMSNATFEFASGSPSSFLPRAQAAPDVNPQLVIVDGAQSGMTANKWADPSSEPWTVLAGRLANAGVTPAQVEVAWIKEAEPHPAMLGTFPTHAQVLEHDLESIVRNLHAAFPNLRIAYVSSRTHAFTTDPAALNPEPYAYESGFSTQWLIANQIQGTDNLNYDPALGRVTAPWLSWGPYLWANGTTPRSDGFTWVRSDVQSDGIHPTASGDAKVADQLLAFFQTDPTATPWFLRITTANQAPVVQVSASIMSGNTPLNVQFTASATDPSGSPVHYVWTFDDGDFSYSQNPTKTFIAPGTYHVHLSVTDDLRNTTQRSLAIDVVFQNVNGLFVGRLYQDVLGRPADSAGLAGWTQQLDAGTLTRLQVAQALIGSDEYRRGVVGRLYQTLLGRTPQPAETAGWSSFLASGNSAEDLEAIILGSPEYLQRQGGSIKNFLTAVYLTALHRSITAGELASWTQSLIAGTSRTAVAVTVLASAESDTVEVQSIYQQLFHQLPDASTQSSLVARLQQGAPDEQILIELSGSRQYAEASGGDANELYVSKLYRDLLQRDADVTALSTDTDLLDSGSMSRLQLAQAILASPEYLALKVQNAYQSLLRRPAENAAVLAFSAFLAQGHTVAEMDAILAGSPEYFVNRGGGSNDGFLGALFEDGLARPIDPSTRQAWLLALANGMSRQTAASAVYSSLEHVVLVVRGLFQQTLNRAPALAELNAYVGVLQSGERESALIATLVSSAEYYTRP
jgi:hypothetical protein